MHSCTGRARLIRSYSLTRAFELQNETSDETIDVLQLLHDDTLPYLLKLLVGKVFPFHKVEI